MAFYYKGTDKNPPNGAVAQPMQKGNLTPALHAWLLLTTNPNWLTFFAEGEIPDEMDRDAFAAKIGITPNSLQFILDRAKDPDTVKAMTVVAGQFQAINEANHGADAYDWPCPDYADLRRLLALGQFGHPLMPAKGVYLLRPALQGSTNIKVVHKQCIGGHPMTCSLKQGKFFPCWVSA